MSPFKTVGLDVGAIGRWSRLGMGAIILAPIVEQLLRDDSARGSANLYGEAILYLVGIVVSYVAVYYFLGEKLFAWANPWINTLILVGPAIVITWWNTAISPAVGVTLPGALALAFGIYVGISFVLQWKIRYGGCEVVALPIMLLKRRYTTYCIPLVVLDAVEKQIGERRDLSKKQD